MDGNSNVIFLRGYHRAVEIGVFDDEYGTPQGLIFDIELAVCPPDGKDDVSSVISYDTLVEAIEAVATGPRLQLLETFAKNLAERCLGDPRARSVTVEIAKLDRLTGDAVLGVRIVRQR